MHRVCTRGWASSHVCGMRRVYGMCMACAGVGGREQRIEGSARAGRARTVRQVRRVQRLPRALPRRGLGALRRAARGLRRARPAWAGLRGGGGGPQALCARSRATHDAQIPAPSVPGAPPEPHGLVCVRAAGAQRRPRRVVHAVPGGDDGRHLLPGRQADDRGRQHVARLLAAARGRLRRRRRAVREHRDRLRLARVALPRQGRLRHDGGVRRAAGRRRRRARLLLVRHLHQQPAQHDEPAAAVVARRLQEGRRVDRAHAARRGAVERPRAAQARVVPLGDPLDCRGEPGACRPAERSAPPPPTPGVCLARARRRTRLGSRRTDDARTCSVVRRPASRRPS